MPAEAPLAVGDPVAYTAHFLHSTGQQAGNLGHARGTITEVASYSSYTLARIDWGDPEIPARVNVVNLCRPGSASFSR